MSELAINGGKPIRDNYLAYGRQSIDDADIDMVNQILRGDYLTTGPTVLEFEKIIADYVGASYAVAVSNGTAALHMACYAAGIGVGDEVIVPPLTFVASSNSVLYQGGTPVFADIDLETYNIDIGDVERKITERTKAIMPVDFAGQPVDMDRLTALADKYNLLIIEDAAHGLGSEYKGKKLGSRADLTEFSFHPVKPITTGEGGIVTTDDDELYQRMLMFRTHGITRDRGIMKDYHGPWYYEQHMLGYNYRITDLQCGLGISQMKRIDDFLGKRRHIAEVYNKSLDDIREIVLPSEPDYSKSGWHIYVIRLRLDLLSVTRRDIFEALRAENIGVNVHYIPVYYQPYYKELGYTKGLCPKAERLYEEIITLPIFPGMDEEDIDDVVKGLKKVINYYKI